MSRTVLALLAATSLASAQNFEVASIKASPPGGRSGGIRPSPGGERYVATNSNLRLLIMVAYRVKAEQIVGGPAWMNTDTYDMNAKAERPSSVEELNIMLQNLLTDRFHLKFHRETKELPIYALTVDKGGHKMKPREAQSAGDPWMDQANEGLHIKLTATSTPMDYFVWRLGQLLDRPVIDQTKLKGSFDFTLGYTREPPPGFREGMLLNGVPMETSGPNLFEALKQQLGLKLEPQKGPVDVLVIDRAEKPVEN